MKPYGIHPSGDAATTSRIHKEGPERLRAMMNRCACTSIKGAGRFQRFCKRLERCMDSGKAKAPVMRGLTPYSTGEGPQGAVICQWRKATTPCSCILNVSVRERSRSKIQRRPSLLSSSLRCVTTLMGSSSILFIQL